MSFRLATTWTVTLLLCVVQLASLSAEEPEPKPTDEDFQLLHEIFALPGGHTIVGATWIEADVGPANLPESLLGWILGESDTQVLLFTWDGTLQTLRKPRANEARPKLKSDDGRGFLLSDINEADRSVLWGYQQKNYLEHSSAFLAKGIPKEIEEDKNNPFDGINRTNLDMWKLTARVISTARCAFYADLLGERRHAEDLYAASVAAHKTFFDRYNSDESKELLKFVAIKLADQHRSNAIFGAHDGTPRSELLELWERVAAIPYHNYHDEGQEMMQHYVSLLNEDARWMEPTPEEREQMTIEQQVDYWMYHLRDLDIGQWDDPGECHVLESRWLGSDEEIPQPAIELAKLGIAAVPKLIEHMEDERPTRCKGHWRMWSPHGQYLLRYGDCCQQIFEDITKHSIYTRRGTTSYPTNDGQAAKCKAKAQAWWDEYQKENPAP